MEAFIIYLVKASGLLALFFIAYYTLLRKVTFFTSNRLFLLAGLLTATLLPLLVYTKIVWITPEPAVAMQQVDIGALSASNSQPAQVKLMPEQVFTINWFYVAIGIYFTGILFFMGSFIADLFNVVKILRGKMVIKKDGFKLIDSSTIQSPFSFFNYIVYNSAILSSEELNAIICHEKVHSGQKHSLDVILVQMFCITFWFNPLAWLYKKAISQNLEFIADAEATKQVADKKAYQKTLLKITVQAENIPITNHFYQSLIKKRIVMLNKQHSKKRNAALYALVVPALVAFVLLFQVEVVAQEKETKEETKTSYLVSSTFSESVVITNKTTDDEIKKSTEKFKSAFADADVNIDNVKRNKAGEIIAITVKIKNKNTTYSSVYEIPKGPAISAFKIELVSTNNEPPVVNFIPFNKNVAANKFEAAMKNADSVTVTASSDSGDGQPSTIKYSINTFKTNGKDGLIIINGVRQKAGSTIDIPFGDEIDDMKILKDKADLAAYGFDGENGVIIITTKRSVGIKQPDAENWLKYQMAKMSADRLPATFNGTPPPRNYDIKLSDNLKNKQVGQPYYLTVSNTYKTSGPEDNIKNIIESTSIDYKKAYLKINGEEATAEELASLNPRKIASIIQMQGTSDAVKEYGSKAINGAIIIETTSYKSGTKSLITKDKNAKFEPKDDGNTGFLIHKKSQKYDLKFYAETLKGMGIKLKYSGLEHNKEGEITSIKIELVDTKTGAKTSGSYSNTNGKGIQDVFVGRRNGELAVNAQ